jgi:hypothetical protein
MKFFEWQLGRCRVCCKFKSCVGQVDAEKLVQRSSVAVGQALEYKTSKTVLAPIHFGVVSYQVIWKKDLTGNWWSPIPKQLGIIREAALENGLVRKRVGGFGGCGYHLTSGNSPKLGCREGGFNRARETGSYAWLRVQITQHTNNTKLEPHLHEEDWLFNVIFF